MFYQRLGLTVSLVMLGLAFLPALELPVLGSPFGFSLSVRWLEVLLLVCLACVGSDLALSAHPLLRLKRRPAWAFWILPSLTVLLAALALPDYTERLPWLVGLAVSGAVLALVIWAEYHTVSLDGPRYAPARLTLDFVAYALALAFCLSIYAGKPRSLIGVPAIGALSWLLSLELLRDAVPLRRAALYAFIAALVMGELFLALNCLSLSARRGGLLLFLAFYLLTGPARLALSRHLRERAAIEFALVGLAGLCLTLSFG